MRRSPAAARQVLPRADRMLAKLKNCTRGVLESEFEHARDELGTWNEKTANRLLAARCLSKWLQKQQLSDPKADSFIAMVKCDVNNLLGRQEHLMQVDRSLNRVQNAFIFRRGKRYLESGDVKVAMQTWKGVLSHNPGHKGVHRCIRDWLILTRDSCKNIFRSDTSDIIRDVEKYQDTYWCQEDSQFVNRLRKRIGRRRIRCIAFAPDNTMYLNDTIRGTVLKLSATGQLEWEKVGTKSPRGEGDLGSFCILPQGLAVSDYRQGCLRIFSPEGELLQDIDLPTPAPLFVQYVPDRQEFHVSDSKLGKLVVLDRNFRKIGEYGPPEIEGLPVQLLYVAGKNQMLVASSVYGQQSAIDLFDIDGVHLNRVATFSQSPIHVAKLTMDDRGVLYAVDHLGAIYRMNWQGDHIWTYREKKRVERFKYACWHQDYLYVSDVYTGTLRRFAVATCASETALI